MSARPESTNSLLAACSTREVTRCPCALRPWRHCSPGGCSSTRYFLPKAQSAAGYLTFQTGKLWNTTFSEVGFTAGMTGTIGRHGGAGLKVGREGLKPIYNFIEDARAKEKSFFVWYAPLLPHDPHTPPERLLAKYRGQGPTPAAEKY